MLTRLQVRNYVLIDSLEIDFPEGLIIITGQTGAGKSILLGALSLVTGAKADASMIAGGADNCVVEAEFSADSKEIRQIMEDNDMEADDVLIIRRVVNRSGRSRAFINDCPVPLQVLQDIASRLVDIHSQHQTLLLSDRRFQMELLDFYAGNSELREKCSGIWTEINSIRAELKSVEDKIARISSEKEYNQAQLAQLEKASLRVGELAELEEEQKRLANAEEIKTALGSVDEMFTASSYDDRMSVDAVLKESVRQLSRIGRYVDSASELSDRIDSCRLELDDILSEVNALNQGIEHSSERLEAVEDRMSLIYGLMKKFSCSDESELIAYRERLAGELLDSSLLEERRGGLLKALSAASSSMEETASMLHDSRAEAAVKFAADVEDSIRFLELPFAVFEVELVDTPISASGRDQAVYKFSSTGHDPVDIAKCASGGEMSRIMLALKSMCAEYAGMPTMVFDEIDTGVSGSVADKMGSMICQMGEKMQVFAITHLPQVAAKGSAHYMVSKEIDPATSKATTRIERLDSERRILEVARMLSGSSLTDAAIANAKSLLSI
ncbi:MAG: DNA repair protein RecN [Bacteroidales bacterium]|nr:DNA repair protein RecN [Bacteroidales bacterium]